MGRCCHWPRITDEQTEAPRGAVTDESFCWGAVDPGPSSSVPMASASAQAPRHSTLSSTSHLSERLWSSKHHSAFRAPSPGTAPHLWAAQSQTHLTALRSSGSTCAQALPPHDACWTGSFTWAPHSLPAREHLPGPGSHTVSKASVTQQPPQVLLSPLPRNQ